MLTYWGRCVNTTLHESNGTGPGSLQLRCSSRSISHRSVREDDNQFREEHHKEASNQENNNIRHDRLVHNLGVHSRRCHTLQVEHIDAKRRSNHAQAKSDTQNQDGGVGVQGRSLDYRSRMGMAIMMIGVVSRNIPITKNSAKISSIRGRPSRLELAKAAATTSDRRVIFTREL